ncbi:CLUMA_CG013387, isoform A [Clunio marinus]|uniref:CLUMA_CG013387, isoform A n=1 Tax=Clunio marinus TaxID=568069 RepID=A0A1J1IK26_9DIPT|nr:CLUMA_CG013387, isoform A [Clunio marinus]
MFAQRNVLNKFCTFTLAVVSNADCNLHIVWIVLKIGNIFTHVSIHFTAYSYLSVSSIAINISDRKNAIFQGLSF